MALCKFCGKVFAWGLNGERWVPLVPVGEEGELPRTFQDSDGVLRSNHRDVCVNRGGPTVRVALLAKAIPASECLAFPTLPSIDKDTGEIHVFYGPPKPKKRGRPRGKAKGWAVEAGLGLGEEFIKRPRKKRA